MVLKNIFDYSIAILRGKLLKPVVDIVDKLFTCLVVPQVNLAIWVKVQMLGPFPERPLQKPRERCQPFVFFTSSLDDTDMQSLVGEPLSFLDKNKKWKEVF